LQSAGIRIGTRGSPLALIQAELVRGRLAALSGAGANGVEIVPFDYASAFFDFAFLLNGKPDPKLVRGEDNGASFSDSRLVSLPEYLEILIASKGSVEARVDALAVEDEDEASGAGEEVALPVAVKGDPVLLADDLRNGQRAARADQFLVAPFADCGRALEAAAPVVDDPVGGKQRNERLEIAGVDGGDETIERRWHRDAHG